MDGCHDLDEDNDDDDDSVKDNTDLCPKGHLGWISTLNNDWDRDGCHDFVEDSNDDQDDYDDINDSCPLGEQMWIADSITISIPKVAHFLAIDFVLVWLYIMNGAESESKDKASSQRNVKPLSGLTLMILNRTAEVPTASAISAIISSL